jgi:hypothetical protein
LRAQTILHGPVRLFRHDRCLEKIHYEASFSARDDSDLAFVFANNSRENGSLALADTFVPSDEKAEFVMKANQHFQNGDHAKGIEQLKLGEVEIRFSRILMPLESTQQRLAEAISLAKEHKFYDANLALKAAVEGLEFDSISLIESQKAAESEAKQG